MWRPDWIAVGLLLVAIAIAIARLGVAEHIRTATDQQVRAAQINLQRLAVLSTGQPATPQRRSSSDVVERLNRSLLSVGLPINTLAAVQPQGEQTSDAGSRVRVQTVLVRLRGLRSADLGTWWQAWSTVGGTWRVVECQWQHQLGTESNPGAESAAGDRDRYDITLLMASPYTADETP